MKDNRKEKQNTSRTDTEVPKSRSDARDLHHEISQEVRSRGGMKKIREDLTSTMMRQDRTVTVDEGGIPSISTRLRHQILEMPKVIEKEASGITIYGRRIRSLVFTTDLAIIRNCDADAVFAVYPFTPQQSISRAIISSSYIPVFCGIGGGTTNGVRTIGLARDVESEGAIAVVLNSPITNVNLLAVSKAIDIPVVITVTSEQTDIGARLESGATILNVAAAGKTPDIVRKIRTEYPEVPIIATGGNDPDKIHATIQAGANAITVTPPSTADLFKQMMAGYREA